MRIFGNITLACKFALGGSSSRAASRSSMTIAIESEEEAVNGTFISAGEESNSESTAKIEK
jgi:hypothetical protein